MEKGKGQRRSCLALRTHFITREIPAFSTDLEITKTEKKDDVASGKPTIYLFVGLHPVLKNPKYGLANSSGYSSTNLE